MAHTGIYFGQLCRAFRIACANDPDRRDPHDGPIVVVVGVVDPGVGRQQASRQVGYCSVERLAAARAHPTLVQDVFFP